MKGLKLNYDSWNYKLLPEMVQDTKSNLLNETTAKTFI